MKLKNNIFISIYILITFVYIFINENIYKNIMKPFENLGNMVPRKALKKAASKINIQNNY